MFPLRYANKNFKVYILYIDTDIDKQIHKCLFGINSTDYGGTPKTPGSESVKSQSQITFLQFGNIYSILSNQISYQ